MARSIQTVVSSGSLVILGVTLDYYERDDITVYFNDVAQLTGWGWVGTTDKTIVFDPAVPAGVTVKLQRRTDVDRMKHIFTSGAQFKSTNVDTNFTQLLHAVQEIQESGVPPSAVGGLDMANEKITSLAPGTTGADAVNKAQLDAAVASVGGTVSAENVGASGLGLFKEKVLSMLRFKKLVQGAGITLTDSADAITISATGGVGGSGTDYFANIADFGAVGDFVLGPGGTGSGTANDTAVMSAIATGKELWIPAGNYYVANWPTRYAYSRATVSGPGKVWGDTSRGKALLGKTMFVGSTDTHEISYAGGVMWAPDGSQNGTRIWNGHHNWMVMQPDAGPAQFQIYPGGKGQAITASCEAPNVLKAVYGAFDTSLLRVGNHVGWFGNVYKVASIIDSTRITVTTFAGGSPGFVTNTTQRAFYTFYEYASFKANVSGSTVTRISGDALPYGVTIDHMYAKVAGTYYNVTQGPELAGANKLTLASSAGTLTNVDVEFFRTYGPRSYVTLFRLQGVAGGTETNGGMALNIKNELRIWNGGTHAELFGPIKINAAKTAIGPGDGADTSGERFEVEADGVWLGGSSATSSALNSVKVYGGGTGYLPVIAARGAESDRGLGFDIPGTGKYGWTAGTYGRTVFEVYAPAGTTAWATVTPGVGKATISANSPSNNADLEVAPAGTGKLVLKRVPFVRLQRVASLRLETATLIPWDTEVSDVLGMHATNDTKIYAPVAGLYRISAQFQAQFYGAAAGGSSVATRIDIKKNGSTTYAALGCITQHQYEAGLVAGSNQVHEIVLAAGDYVEIRAVQLSNGSGDGHADMDSTDLYTSVAMSLVSGT